MLKDVLAKAVRWGQLSELERLLEILDETLTRTQQGRS